jgi:hypothetical protein
MPRKRECNQHCDEQPTVVQPDFDAEDSAQFNLCFHILVLICDWLLRWRRDSHSPFPAILTASLPSTLAAMALIIHAAGIPIDAASAAMLQ